MTVYTISGTELSISVDGGSGTIASDETTNPITGGSGLNTVRVVNTSSANIATMSFNTTDAAYTFEDVTGTPSGAGANAAFNVTATNFGYVVEIANGGNGYANAETITILGNALGGTTTANDLTLTLTVGTVANVAGVITRAVSAGTPLWPQSYAGTVSLLPRSESFIQVTKTTDVGGFFTSTGNDGDLLICPVTIVG